MFDFLLPAAGAKAAPAQGEAAKVPAAEGETLPEFGLAFAPVAVTPQAAPPVAFEHAVPRAALTSGNAMRAALFSMGDDAAVPDVDMKPAAPQLSPEIAMAAAETGRAPVPGNGSPMRSGATADVALATLRQTEQPIEIAPAAARTVLAGRPADVTADAPALPDANIEVAPVRGAPSTAAMPDAIAASELVAKARPAPTPEAKASEASPPMAVESAPVPESRGMVETRGSAEAAAAKVDVSAAPSAPAAPVKTEAAAAPVNAINRAPPPLAEAVDRLTPAMAPASHEGVEVAEPMEVSVRVAEQPATREQEAPAQTRPELADDLRRRGDVEKIVISAEPDAAPEAEKLSADVATDGQAGEGDDRPERRSADPDGKDTPIRATADDRNVTTAQAAPAAGLATSAALETPAPLAETSLDPLSGLAAVRTETASLAMAGPATAAYPPPSAAQLLGAMEQIASAIVEGREPSTIQLRLDPAELGRVEIDLSFDNSTVNVVVRAEREDVLDLMRRSADDLMRMLRDAGLTTGTLDFGGQGSMSGGGADGEARAERGERYTPDAVMPEIAQRSMSTSGGVDLRL